MGFLKCKSETRDKVTGNPVGNKHHRSLRLLLLSRINGDAPALMQARRLDDSRAGLVFKLVEVAQFEHLNARFFARFRFVEAHLVPKLLFSPESRKGTHTQNVNETICR